MPDLKFPLVIAASFILLFSCRKAIQVAGIPPVADAGEDQSVYLPISYVTLDGSKSVDPEGRIVSYQWTRLKGPANINLSESTNPRATVKSLSVGLYQFELLVTDNEGLTDRDTVEIVVYSIDPTPFTPPSPGLNSNCIIPGSEKVGEFPEPIVDARAIVCNDRIYFSNGYALDEFNPANGHFTRLLLDLDLSHIALAALGDEIFVAGGYKYPTEFNVPGISYKRVDIFNTRTRQWQNADLSKPRFGIKTCATEGKVFFAGGRYDAYTYSSVVDVYDPVKKTWSFEDLGGEFEILPVALANEVWFFKSESNEVRIYDKINDTWRTWTAGKVVKGHDAILLNNKIYITGLQVIQVYDIPGNTWSELKLSESKFYVPAVACNNKLIFVGGMTSWFVYSTLLEIYDPVTKSWSIRYMSGDLGFPSIVSYNNYLYCAGGMIDQENTYLSGICRLQL